MAMKTVRFRVHGGRLEPLEPLALLEGAEIDVSVPLVPPAGTAASVLAAMRRLPDIDDSSVDALDQAIDAGKLPVAAIGAFDRHNGSE
jgi:hypothetical protein